MVDIKIYKREKELIASHYKHFSKKSESPLKKYLKRFDYDISEAVVIKEKKEELLTTYTLLIKEVVIEIPFSESQEIKEFDVEHYPLKDYLSTANREMLSTIKLSQQLFKREKDSYKPTSVEHQPINKSVKILEDKIEYRVTLISKLYYLVLWGAMMSLACIMWFVPPANPEMEMPSETQLMIGIFYFLLILFTLLLTHIFFINPPKIVTTEDNLVYQFLLIWRKEIKWSDINTFNVKNMYYRGVRTRNLELVMKNSKKRTLQITDICSSIEGDVSKRISNWKCFEHYSCLS